MADLTPVMVEHHGNVGWREGANNDNKWGPEQGVGNHLAYCDSAASMVPYHHGVNWWPDCTFGAKGCAYTVAHVEVARRHGKYMDDHAGLGRPAPLAVGQPVFFDWNRSGSVDHVETVSALPQGPLGGQYETIGYNTGPNDDGCYRLLRDRTYLHGTIVMDDFYAAAPTPPIPSEEDDDMRLIQITDGPDTGKIFLINADCRRYIDTQVELDQLIGLLGPVKTLGNAGWQNIVELTALDALGLRSLPPIQYQQLIHDVAAAVKAS